MEYDNELRHDGALDEEPPTPQEQEEIDRQASLALITPDIIIVLDYLIYRLGNQAEQEAWETVKKAVKGWAHGSELRTRR